MQKVFLVRHGKVENPSDFNYGDLEGFPLSEEGRDQIKNLAVALKDSENNFCKIIASPLQRTQETAEILSLALNTEVIFDVRLKEWDMGDWMGKPLKDFYEKSGYYSPEMRTDGMEPLKDLADRVIASITDSIKLCKADIIICSHREPMAAAIVKLQNLSWKSVQEIDMPMGSVWQLNFSDQKFTVGSKIF